jgi:spermidine synthase
VKTDFPETAIVGENVKISADVTMTGKSLKDANVDFDVVPKDSDQENYIDAELQDNGFYQLDYIFTEPGTYVIAAHVYWKDLHTMEYKYIEVSPKK